MYYPTFSLKTKLVGGCLLMLCFSLILSGLLIGIYRNFSVRAENSVAHLAALKQVLSIAGGISAERGPMDVVIGEDLAADTPSRRKLASIRASIDQGFIDLLESSAKSGEFGAYQDVKKAVELARSILASARQSADALIALPKSERSTEAFFSVLDGMFQAYDAMRPLIALTIARISAEDPAFAGPAMMAQMLAELREYAGRLGSITIPFIIAEKPISPIAMKNLLRTRERIASLWQLTGNQAGLYSDDKELLRLSHEVESKYFGLGMPRMEAIAVKGETTGQFGITIDQALADYVPTMATIDHLRARFIDSATERLVADDHRASLGFIQVSLLVSVVIASTVALVVGGRLFVLRPLLMASANVIALSKGKLEVLASPTRSGEVGALFGALEDLRLMLCQRLEYTEQLKVLSETDGLTGLMNRRLFDRIGLGDPEFASLPGTIAVILLDLDWFKRINDTYGHLAGDIVLKDTARLVQRICSATDIAARVGGEEIAIIVMDAAPIKSAPLIAERVRSELEQTPIVLENGQKIVVTASFGVAYGKRGPETWNAIVSRADACLYRAKTKGRNRVCYDLSDGSALPGQVEDIADRTQINIGRPSMSGVAASCALAFESA